MDPDSKLSSLRSDDMTELFGNAGITTFPGSRSGHSGCGASEGHLPVNDAGGQPAPVAPVKNPFVRLLNARKVRRPGAVKVPQRPNSDPPIGTRDQSLTLPGEDPDTQARGPTKLTVPLSKRISRASQLNGISSDPMQQPIRKKPKTRHRNAEDCNHTKPGAASRAQHYHLGPGEAGAIHNGHDHVVEEAVTRPKLDRKPVQHSSAQSNVDVTSSGQGPKGAVSLNDVPQHEPSDPETHRQRKNNESSEHVEEAVHCDNSAADKSNDLLEEWEEAARADSDAACRSNDLLKAWEEAARQDAKANAGKSDDLLEAWEEAARQDAEANEAHGKDVQEASDEAAGQRPQCGKRAPGIGRVPDRTTRKKKKRPVIILAWPTDTQKSCQPKSPDAEHSNTTPPGQQAQQSKCRLSPDVHPSSTASTEAGPLHSARSSSDHEVLACSPQIPKKAQKEAATPPSLPHMAQLHQQLQLFMSAAASSGEFSCVPPKIMESVKQCLELMQQHTFSEVRDPTRHAYGAEQHDHEDPTPCTGCPPTSAQCRAKGRAGDPLASQHARPEDATAGGGESAEQAAAADLPAAPVHVRTTAAEQGCAGEYGARVTMPAPVRAERQTAPAQGPAQHTDKDAPAGPTAPPPPDASYRQYSEQCQAAFITGQKSSAADSAPKAQSVPSHQASAPDNFTERTSAAEHDASDRLPDVKGVQGAPASNLLPDLQQPQHAESDMLVDEAISNVGIARRHDPEVEAAEWARRHAEVQRQRQEKKAERLAAAERAAVKRAREQRERETAEMELRNRLRADKQRHLRRIVLKEFNLRQALNALNIPVSAGPAGDRAALRRARIYYHPDQSRKRGDSLADQIMSEEVFKLLGSLA